MIGQPRCTLALVGYFRRLIANFSQKAKPLVELLTGHENQKGSRETIDWDTGQQEALETLLTEQVNFQC